MKIDIDTDQIYHVELDHYPLEKICRIFYVDTDGSRKRLEFHINVNI